MKILMIHNFYGNGAPSGEDVVFRHECKILKDAGHHVVEFTRSNQDIHDAAITKRIGFALSMVWSFSSFRDIKAVARREMPDVVHFHNTFPLISPSGYYACKSVGLPVVQTLHNYRLFCLNGMMFRRGMPCRMCLGKLPYMGAFYGCYRKSVFLSSLLAFTILLHRVLATHKRKVDIYIAPTNFVADIASRAGLAAERIRVKPHSGSLAASSGCNEIREYLLFVGRLSEEKGCSILIRAMRLFPHLTLKVVGDGPQRKELESLAVELGVKVDFVGMVSRDDAARFMLRAIAVVVPSLVYEAFGMVVLEAYTRGAPVLAAKIGGLASLVDDGKTGFLFEAGDLQSLCDAIGRLLSARHSGSLSTNVKEYFLRRFGDCGNVFALEKIYGEARSRKMVQ